MVHPHGIRITEISEGVRQLSGRATNVIGLVCTSDDADLTLFPNDGVSLITDIDYAISKAGESGTMAQTLEAIAYQCKPIICMARVPTHAEIPARNEAVIGSISATGVRTGIKALEAALSMVGVRPKILACPGLDTQAVITGMVSAAQRLRAMAYASCNSQSVSEAIAFRANFGARELMLFHQDFKRVNGEIGHVGAYAAGLRAKIDKTDGWAKTISNTAINGVTGLSAKLEWDALSGDNDVGLLNDNEITGLILNDGFKFWGNRTCSDDPLFSYESATRAAHVLYEKIGEGMIWAIDKKLTPRHGRDIIESIQAGLDDEVSAGNLIGASVWLSEGLNTQNSLAAGGLYIDYDYTAVAPLECLHLQQRITSRYYLNFAEKLISSIATN